MSALALEHDDALDYGQPWSDDDCAEAWREYRDDAILCAVWDAAQDAGIEDLDEVPDGAFDAAEDGFRNGEEHAADAASYAARRFFSRWAAPVTPAAPVSFVLRLRQPRARTRGIRRTIRRNASRTASRGDPDLGDSDPPRPFLLLGVAA